MDFGPLFPGLVNTAGALLPAVISLGIVVARRARSQLSTGDQFWLGVFSVALSAVLARASVTPDAVALHIPPGATLLVCYLVWRGHYVSPGLAFALTYASCLPVDVCLAQLVTGSEFSSEGIGGAGWLDGLLIFPALNALAVGYANWRMARTGRAGLFWFGQGTEGHKIANDARRRQGQVLRNHIPPPYSPKWCGPCASNWRVSNGSAPRETRCNRF
jgi:hypothetical protein